MGAIVGVLVVVAYARVFSGGFVWDDDAHVTAPALRSLEGLWRIWTDLSATQQYYPLLHSVFWIEHVLWGDAVLGYHVVTLGFHLAAAVLFARVLCELRVPGATLAAAIFALHPVHVESVAWISEHKNTLSAVLYLGAAFAYLRFDRERRTSLYIIATLCFLAALLTKTVVATLPAALLVVLWWRNATLHLRRDVAPLLPWLVLGIVAGVFTAWVERTLIGAQGAEFELSLVQRTLLAARVVPFYFGKLLWPVNLTFIYPRWTISASDTLAWLRLLAGLGVIAGAWSLRRRTRAPLAIVLLFIGTLVPVLGFLNVYPFRYSFVADHFQYLASLSVIAGAAAGVTRLLSGATRGAFVAGGALLLALAVMISAQCVQYRDVSTLWRVTVARNPAASMAWVHLGSISSKAGRSDEAIALYRRAASVNPRDADAWSNLGAELTQLGRADEALPLLERALQLEPDNPAVRNNHGYALARLGRHEPAIVDYLHALRVRPGYGEARNNLAIALTELGRPAEALSHFERALRDAPNEARTHHNYANALRQLQRSDAAIAAYRRALQLDPSLAETHDDLGVVLLAAGRTGEAIPEFEAALRLNPRLSATRLNLGQALGESGRLPQALEQFDAAIQLTPEFGPAWLKRGVALAALDRWGDAREALTRAVALLPKSAEARRHLGMAFANSGALPRAQVELETAVSLEPEVPENHLTLAQLLQAMGRTREADEHRARAAALARARR